MPTQPASIPDISRYPVFMPSGIPACLVRLQRPGLRIFQFFEKIPSTATLRKRLLAMKTCHSQAFHPGIKTGTYRANSDWHWKIIFSREAGMPQGVFKKLEQDNTLGREDIMALLNLRDPADIQRLFRAARQTRKRVFGTSVFLYGFLYFSTHCRK